MLRILGNPSRPCEGITRREVLRAGGLSSFGTITLPRLLQASASRARESMFSLVTPPTAPA
jgi:hypothetical protein